VSLRSTKKKKRTILIIISLFLLAIITGIVVYFVVNRPVSKVLTHYDQGLELYNDHQYAAAINEFQAQIDQDATSIDAYVKQAEIAQLQHQPQASENYLNAGLKVNPDNLQLTSKLADLLFISNRYPEAQVLYLKLYQADKTNTDAILPLFKIYALTRNNKGELDLLNALSTGNDLQSVFFARYVMYLANQQILPLGDDATAILLPDKTQTDILGKLVISTKYLTQTDNALLGYTNITYDLIQGGYYEFAFPFAEQMINENKFFDKGYLYRGIIYSHIGDFQEAETDFNKALQLKSDSINSYVLMYEVKAALNKTSELDGLTTKIEELYNDNDQNYIWELFKIIDKYHLYQQGVDLLTYFEPKLTNYPQEINFISLKFYFLIDDLPDTTVTINKVLANIAVLNNEQKALVYSIQSYLAYKNNALSESDLDLTKAEELYKYSPFVHYIKGRILSESGKGSLALSYLQKAQELDSNLELSKQIEALLNENTK